MLLGIVLADDTYTFSVQFGWRERLMERCWKEVAQVGFGCSCWGFRSPYYHLTKAMGRFQTIHSIKQALFPGGVCIFHDSNAPIHVAGSVRIKLPLTSAIYIFGRSCLYLSLSFGTDSVWNGNTVLQYALRCFMNIPKAPITDKDEIRLTI